MSLNPTGIEWTHVFGEGTGYTWNPITGCRNGCDYCYARALVETRLKDVYPQGFAPTFWPDRLRDVTPKQKPRGIFCGSMTDLWDSVVPQEWRDQVWESMARAEQHVYFTLTKQPQNIRPNNVLGDIWAGVTVTRREELRPWEWPWCPDFVSFEPLLGPVCLDAEGWCPDWAIIGADSRPAGIAHNTAREWVEHLVSDCEARSVPVFAKNNLARVMGAEWVAAHQQWPEELQKLREEART